MFNNPMFELPMTVDKNIREDKTQFDKTVVAQQFLDILSGYRHLKVVQELIQTLLSYALESLKVGKLSESAVLMIPQFYSRMLLFYTETTEAEEPSLIEELFNARKEEQDPRLLAMQDTKFMIDMIREAQGQGVSEERRKLILDKLLVQLGSLTGHNGIAAEHRECIDKFAGLLLSSGEHDQAT